ncbi:MAG TPA: sulfite exporter TauE/SafE family protein [Caldithrix abyssi]|uniref:Probable membrane transporter protein n=1 Tax=Caldithrix abyssi TaxID=187145 RepID=A0A7V5UEI9_CALAY|nr:sulfite exporter TauE/SafE family protein [Caldithrix abyssi]
MNLPVSELQALLAVTVGFLGGMLQSNIGFGLGPLGVPLLLLIDPRFVPGPVIINGLVLNILMIRREHDFFKMKEFKWAIAGRVVGTILGAGILVIIPLQYLSLLFAGLIILAVLLSVSRLNLKISARNLLLSGTLSGMMGTTVAIGGPAMALVYQRSSGPRVRSMLSAIFLIGTILALISLASIGRLGKIELELALILLPGVLAGFFLSRYSIPVMDRGFIRPAILLVSAVSALILLIKQFL